MATPWTYFLRLSLSSVVLTDSATGSPVHVLMLSTQVVRGLPRLHSPGIVPCIPWGVVVVVVVMFFSRPRDPRVGHTMDVLSPFIPVLCHCDLTLPLGVLSTSSSLTLTLLRRIARPPVRAERAVPTTVQTPALAEASEVPAGYTDQVRSIIDIDKLSTRGAARRYASADGSSTRGGSTFVHGGGPQSAHVQAAGSQRAYSLGSCATQSACYSLGWDRQTDGSRYRLPPSTAKA